LLNAAPEILPLERHWLRALQTGSHAALDRNPIDVTLVRMQKGRGADYEDDSHLVLDDWR